MSGIIGPTPVRRHLLTLVMADDVDQCEQGTVARLADTYGLDFEQIIVRNNLDLDLELTRDLGHGSVDASPMSHPSRRCVRPSQVRCSADPHPLIPSSTSSRRVLLGRWYTRAPAAHSERCHFATDQRNSTRRGPRVSTCWLIRLRWLASPPRRRAERSTASQVEGCTGRDQRSRQLRRRRPCHLGRLA